MLKILLKTNQKIAFTESGFTLLEVLVAVLIGFFFVIGSMQALVLATAIRVEAQERQRADQLIQEDIEQVKSTASTLAVDHKLCSATAFDPSNNDGTGGVYDSYAEKLFWTLPGVPSPKYLIEGVTTSKQYSLNRTRDETNSTAKVLKINYTVVESGSTVATDYLEVIPNAAIQCP